MNFEYALNILKSAWVSIMGWLTGMLLYFLPIKDLTYAISLIFVVNFLSGYISGMLVSDEQFNIKKALWAFAEVACYICFIILLFILGSWIKQEHWLYTSIQTATYAWIWFYAINILKNWKRLFPNSKPIAFLYFFLSLEFVKNIPYMKEFQENQKNNKQND